MAFQTKVRRRVKMMAVISQTEFIQGQFAFILSSVPDHQEMKHTKTHEGKKTLKQHNPHLGILMTGE